MLRFRNKVTAAVLSAALFAAMVCAPSLTEPAFAASDKGLSVNSAVMRTGSTLKLKVKGAKKDVKWKTSDKKIATVKSVKGKYGQTAVIKAGKKAGKCRITVKYGKKKQTCTIRTIKLSKATKELTASVKAGKAKRAGGGTAFRKAAADFSFEILRQTAAQDAAEGKTVNTLVSPDSILTALVMVENGAKGKTLREMQDALSGGISVSDYNRYLSGLNYRLTSSKTVKYHVANSIWTRKGAVRLKKKFLKKNKTYHNAQIFSAPFSKATVKDMNRWVEGNTSGMIKKILSRLTKDDRVVLINAIAFEGRWTQEFSDPQKELFTTDKGASKKVDTLLQRDRMDYITVNGGKGFAKPYRGGKIAFVGLLPPEGSTVDEYLAGLKGSEFITAWKGRKSRLLDISVPEFKYDYSASMAVPLKRMGMRTAFTDSANLSGMIASSSPEKGIRIDDVLHKTHIELDKHGTKAAAATAVIAKSGCAPLKEEVTEIHLDRPFVYVLVDTKTGIPLFAGILRYVK